MRQISLYLSSFMVASILLAGCDKAEKMPSSSSETKTQSVTKATSTPTVIDGDAAIAKGQIAVTDNTTHQTVTITPTGRKVADLINTSAVVGMAKMNPSIPKEQPKVVECLMQEETAMSYYGLAQEFINKNFTPVELKKLDDVFVTDISKKGTKIADEKMMEMVTGKPTANPTTLTPEEKKQAIIYNQMPEVKKLQSVFQAEVSSETPFLMKMTDIANKQTERCGLPLAP